MNRSALVGVFCLGLSIAGWFALFLSYWLVPEGHPPLWAYVAMLVVPATVLLSLLGVLMGINGVRKNAGSTLLNWGLLLGNGVILSLSVLAVGSAM